MQPEVAAGVNLPPKGEKEGRDADWENARAPFITIMTGPQTIYGTIL